MLQLQQLHLFVNAPGVARETPVRADDPVTGNDDGYLIVPHRTADGLRRSEERRVGKECRSRWSPYH